MVVDLERLLEKRKHRTARGGSYPLNSFLEKILRLRLTENFAETATGSNAKKIKSEARRQCVISLVTALEVYLGDLIVELIDDVGIEYNKNISESLKEKYNILEVDLILKNEITIGELICGQINFQNIDKTFSFLTSLLGTNFSKLLTENKFEYENIDKEKVQISLRRDFIKRLAKLLERRHRYTHEIDFTDTPSRKDIIACRVLIRRLVFCIDVKADILRGVSGSAIISK